MKIHKIYKLVIVYIPFKFSLISDNMLFHPFFAYLPKSNSLIRQAPCTKTFRKLAIHKIDLVLKVNILPFPFRFVFEIVFEITNKCFTSLRQNETYKLFKYHPSHLNIDPSNELRKNALLGTFKQMT